ncbi:hypothetical protein QYF36_009176 [Acer negundo]|nr:hypothetical protein QYF36_009176 [Acer negundo]
MSARITPEVEVHSYTLISIADKGKGITRVHRNLGCSLVEEDLIVAKVLVTNGSYLHPYNARLDDIVHGKVRESTLLRKEVELLANAQIEPVHSLSSVEMEVDKGLLNHTVSSMGKWELVKNQTGTKVGKWKRWVKDGAKTESDAQGGPNLGKRTSGRQVLGLDKKQKVVSNEEILPTKIDESSTGWSLPVYRSQ